MTGVDLDYLNKRLLTAFVGIADGKGLNDVVVVECKQANILNALNDAVTYFDEEFHADHLDTVDRAYSKLQLVRTSQKKNVVAKEIRDFLRTRPP